MKTVLIMRRTWIRKKIKNVPFEFPVVAAQCNENPHPINKWGGGGSVTDNDNIVILSDSCRYPEKVTHPVKQLHANWSRSCVLMMAHALTLEQSGVKQLALRLTTTA